MNHKGESTKAHSVERNTLSFSRSQRITYPSKRPPGIPSIVRWSLMLYVFVLPLEHAQLSFMASFGTLPKMAGVLFLGTFLYYHKRCFARPSPAIWWFWGYLAIYSLHGLYLPQIFRAQYNSHLVTMVQLIILLWFISNLLKRDKDLLKHILYVFSFSAVLLSFCTLLGVPGFSVVKGEFEQRMSSMGFNPGILGYLLVVGAVILIGFALQMSAGQRWHKALLLFMTLPLLALTAKTASRLSLGAFFIGIAVYLIPFTRSSKRMRAMFLAGFGMLVMVYMIFASPVAMTRLNKTFEEGHSSGRDVIFQISMDMIAQRPFFGWQPIAALYEIGQREKLEDGQGFVFTQRQTHNLYLYLLVEVGIIGTIPFLAALYLCGRGAWKARNGSLGLIPFALFGVLGAESMAITGIKEKIMWFILALALGSASLQRGNFKKIKRSQLGKVSNPLAPKRYAFKR